MTGRQEINNNQRAFQNALAQQYIEGLHVPQSVVEDMQRAMLGEITSEQGIDNIYQEFPNVKIFQPR